MENQETKTQSEIQQDYDEQLKKKYEEEGGKVGEIVKILSGLSVSDADRLLRYAKQRILGEATVK